MIHLSRPDCPSVLLPTSRRRKTQEARLIKIVDGGRLPGSEDFNGKLYGDHSVREVLHAMHNGRCCYCERLRDPFRESDVEHFRPKAKIEEERQPGGYWWLAYEWDNLFFACRRCNQENKKCFFPISGRRSRSKDDDLSQEQPLLLNPAEEDPAESLLYDWVTIPGQVVPSGRGSSGVRGNTTVAKCGLDDPSLNSHRHAILETLRALECRAKYAQYLDQETSLSSAANEIFLATSAKEKHEFIGFRRWYFRVAGLGEFVANDH